VISPTQIPLPYNTQHTQETDIRASGGIWICPPSKRTTSDSSIRPRGHRLQPVTI